MPSKPCYFVGKAEAACAAPALKIFCSVLHHHLMFTQNLGYCHLMFYLAIARCCLRYFKAFGFIIEVSFYFVFFISFTRLLAFVVFPLYLDCFRRASIAPDKSTAVVSFDHSSQKSIVALRGFKTGAETLMRLGNKLASPTTNASPTLSIGKQDVFWLYIRIELHPVHCIGRYSIAAIQDKLGVKIIPAKKEGIRNPNRGNDIPTISD